jgi:hypothetical protein
LRPGKQSKAIGNALTAGRKSLSFLFNQLLTDQFIAGTAGQKEDSKEISGDNLNQKIPLLAGFFVLSFIFISFCAIWLPVL